MKFLVDMPLSPALARWLGIQGHDAVHAAALGLGRAADARILAQARRPVASRHSPALGLIKEHTVSINGS